MMACHTHEEIAAAVGYTRRAIGEFLDLLQEGKNGTGAVFDQMSKNAALTSNDLRAFDEDENQDTNSLGVYQHSP